MAQNHYQTLQVFPGSSMSEIRKAYRRLAMKIHPDKNSGNEQAANQFLKIKEAYDLLSDEQQRRDYDRRNGFTYNRHAAPPTIPMMLVEISALRHYVESLNLHTLDHDALAYHLRKSLTHQRINILQQQADEQTIRKIRDELVAASRPLRFSLLPEALTPLKELLQHFPPLDTPLQEYMKERQKARRLESSAPWLVLLVTALLCYLIFKIT